MILILTRKVRPSLKGELTRWLMQPIPGVFLGHVSQIVREALWERCENRVGKGGCALVYPWPNEQGFKVRTCGTLPREIVEIEGLYFSRKPRSAAEKTESSETSEDLDSPPDSSNT